MDMKILFESLSLGDKLQLRGLFDGWTDKFKVFTDTPSLPQSYEDCFKKVLPGHYIDSANRIQRSDIDEIDANNIAEHNNNPTLKCAQQLQAAAKLFVVTHAINGEEWEPTDREEAFHVCYDRIEKKLVLNHQYSWLNNPYPFRTADLAEHAMKIAEPIWLQYFGV